MNTSPSKSANRAEETAPGVRMLREIWRIKDKPTREERLPEKISSDIYNVPGTSRRVSHPSHMPR